MSDQCRTKTVTVVVQENGIIRDEWGGRIVARLLDGIEFDSFTEDKRIEQLEAENKRLREALDQIIKARPKGYDSGMLKKIAKKALEVSDE